MIISHSKKFIFVHIPKTAGTSITRYLDRYSTYQDLTLGSTKYGERIQPYYKKKYKIWKHSTSFEIKNVVGDETWNEYLSFSLVRNPWDRMVSFYEWCCSRQFKSNICEAAIQAGSFSKFVRSECFSKCNSQLKYLTDSKGNIITNFVGKQESIQEDFDYICNKLGIPITNMSNMKQNISRKSHAYRKYYTSDEDIEIIKNQFSSEIKAFNYKF